MSVYPKTEYRMYCNGIHKDGVLEGHGCYRGYDPPEGLDHVPKPAELRKLAAKEGWTHVRSQYGRRHDQDFCPEHSDQGDVR